jgi:hypothetical protein
MAGGACGCQSVADRSPTGLTPQKIKPQMRRLAGAYQDPILAQHASGATLSTIVQGISSDGAGVAGPIMNKVMQAALPAGSVSQPCTVPPVPTSTFTSNH